MFTLDRKHHDWAFEYLSGTELHLKRSDGSADVFRVKAVLDESSHELSVEAEKIWVLELEHRGFAVIFDEDDSGCEVHVLGSLAEVGDLLYDAVPVDRVALICLFRLGMLNFDPDLTPVQIAQLREAYDW